MGTLLYLPLAALLLAVLTGILLGLCAAGVDALAGAMTTLRPLHLTAVMATLLGGIAACAAQLGVAAGAPRLRLAAALAGGLLPGFFVAAAASLLLGAASGVEYLAWSARLTPVPLACFLVLAAGFFADLRRLAAHAPEGSWLFGLGLVCIVAGLGESLLPEFTRLGYARVLSYRWHALDILFAGINACFYGAGIFVARRAGKALRPVFPYLIAAFAFASTFGHHHYRSPQPHAIKWIAVAASLLAGVSFVRHWRARRRHRGAVEPARAADPFLAVAERWTLIAIASGVLFAVPQLNLLVHGTHAVVAHAMGAAIGVPVMLLFATAAHAAAPRDAGAVARLARRARRTDGLLRWTALDLAVAGVAEGWLRMERPHAETQVWVEALLLPLPLLGAALAWSLCGTARALLFSVPAAASRAAASSSPDPAPGRPRSAR